MRTKTFILHFALLILLSNSIVHAQTFELQKSLSTADSLYSVRQFDRAIAIYLITIDYLKSDSIDAEKKAVIFDRIGNFYSSIEQNFTIAKEYFDFGYEVRKKHSPHLLWKSTYNLAALCQRKSNYNCVIEYLTQLKPIEDLNSIKEKEIANMHFLLGTAHQSLFLVNGTKEDAIKGLEYLTKSSNQYLNLKDSLYWASSLMELGQLSFSKGDNQKALDYLNEVSILPLIKENLRYNSLKADIHKQLGDADSVHFFKTKETNLLRQKLNSSNINSVAEITEDYRTDKEVDKLQANAEKLGIALGISAIVLIISYLIFLQTIQRKKLENLQAVVLGEEQERKRLAKDLHDGIGVLLTSIRMRLSSFEEKVEDQKAYHDSLEQIDNACTEVRRVSHNLSPASLEKLGLEEALLDLVDQVKLTGGLEVEEEVSIEHGLLKTEEEVLVYRIVQELINNTLKYAEASQIRFSLRKQANDLRLTFHDNGKGFDQQKVKPGIGLKSIASRLDILKGKMHLNAQIGMGTQFEITIPVNV